MRLGSVILLIWLLIGAIAAGQRHYYSTSSASCAGAGRLATSKSKMVIKPSPRPR